MANITLFGGPLSIGDVATCLGLALTAFGAWKTARAAIVTIDQAREIGVARWVPEKPEDQDKLPHVKSILAQSRGAQWGLIFILFGALLQFGPIVEKILTYADG